MNACETLIVPYCRAGETGMFDCCIHAEPGDDGLCRWYSHIATDIGEFHKCACRMAVEESVMQVMTFEPEPEEPTAEEMAEIEATLGDE